ncbi:MAG: MerC domain-containing protein [Novosphingobium sp.]
MRDAVLSIRNRLDGLGMVLSGLCAVHCVLGLVLVTVLGLGGGLLLRPEIHEIGLALAVGVGVLTLGLGALRHGRTGPLLIGGCGIALMAAALTVEHGPWEAVLTIAGVALVAFAHVRNLRGAT